MSNPAEQQASKASAKRPAEPRNDENKRPHKSRARPQTFQGMNTKLYNFNAETLAVHTPEAFDKLLGRFVDLSQVDQSLFFSPISSKQKSYIDLSSSANQERRATGLSIRENIEKLNTETRILKGDMEALQAQREKEKEESRGLKGSFEELSARHTILEEHVGELTLDNANLYKEIRNFHEQRTILEERVGVLMSDNAKLHEEVRKIHAQVNFLEEKESPVVCGEIINCTYVLLGRRHKSRLPKYESLCVIYMKLDEAYDYVPSFLAKLTMDQFRPYGGLN